MPKADDQREVIEYHFPVEIEVVGSTSTVDVEAIVDLALGRLADHLEGLA